MEQSKVKRFGILTSGGDAPGLNAAIRGVARTAMDEFGMEVIGIENGYRGLIEGKCRKLEPEDFSGILTRGGTILGTSREKPFKNYTIYENGKTAVDKIKENYSLKKIIAVADKGMNSSKNIDYLINNGNGFVFSQILKGKKGKRYHEIMFDENGYTYNSSKTFKYKTFIEDYDATDKDGNKIKRQRKVLIYWKYEDALMAARKRDDKLDKALKSLGNNAFTIKHAYDEYLKELYTTKNGEIADTVYKTVDYEKAKEDAKFDGYFAIVTSELDFDYSKILETYSGLWRIEESFRITKSQLEVRPIFVRTQKHIEGHFLICFISLLLIRMLQLKMNYSLSAERIIEALNTSMCITDSPNKVRVLKNDEVLLFDKTNKLTLDNRTINDLLQIINAMDAEIPYAEYTKQEFDKYLNSIVYKP